MQTFQLLKRNLNYYWRTNLTVVLGVATAVAVLAGALLVGDSVRGSLRDLFLQRLGKADYLVASQTFFRAEVAADLEQRFDDTGFNAACPLIVLRGSILHEKSRQQAAQVVVYGVDERFWKFHNQPAVADLKGQRAVFIGESLARELGSIEGDAVLLRVEKPSDIPVESLHGRKENPGLTLRLTVRGLLPATALGEFSPQPHQGIIRVVFVPLDMLQQGLQSEGRVNTILVSKDDRAPDGAEASELELAALEKILNASTRLEDFGVRLHALEARQAISLETDSKLVNDQLAESARVTAEQLALESTPVLAYLANSINAKERSVPYSLVVALDELTFKRMGAGETEPVQSPTPGASAVSKSDPSIILNDWTARDLGVRPGDSITLEYYLWHEDGRLETKNESFNLAAVAPISGLAADRQLVPEYPGITETENLSDWDPPFPIDLGLVRKVDEDYWEQYRTTPKAFIPLEVGQRLWQSRFGKLTSIRIASKATSPPVGELLDSFGKNLRARLRPSFMGIEVLPVRAQGLQASRGATDFGEYFLYFSFFLVVSALLLTAIFFKLGVEQRLREIGTLEAIGFSPGKVRNLFVSEGLILSVVGSLIGLAGAIAYGQLLMYGLRTWWVGAVGTTMLRLHVNPISLLLGGTIGVLAALVCIALTLRSLARASTRSLLTGSAQFQTPKEGVKKASLFRRLTIGGFALVIISIALALLLAAGFGQVGQVAGFFGGGSLLLVGLLLYQSSWLQSGSVKTISGKGWWPISRLGFRNTTSRPGRSILCIALIAAAAFVIVAVDAFRRDDKTAVNDRQSGSGGFSLLAESLLPVVHDPNSAEGREALNLATEGTETLRNISFTRFRLRPGDDASCLNLYQPGNPRIIAPDDQFLSSGRFTFQSAAASSDQEKQNPWLLLNRELADGVVPVIGDANSLTYVLHLGIGDELTLNLNTGPVKLRIVGALADSIFQSELLMSEKNFLRLFPGEQGHRLFLIETPGLESAGAVAAALEDRLSDYGFDVVRTNERLAEFHRVENTYLSTFQLLGGLGLILGTLGMAAVLLRNVLERRHELALLRAVGYNRGHFTLMVVAENAFLLFSGLVIGALCALLAVGPIVFARGSSGINSSLVMLLLLVMLSGLTASLAATVAALRAPLLPALKTE